MTAFEKTTVLWGNFHVWLKALTYCWTTWKDVTKFFFTILFPHTEWWTSPTSANLIQFYDYLFKCSFQLLDIIHAEQQKSGSQPIHKQNFLKQCEQFIDVVVPTLHYYYLSLKHKNFKTFQILQWQMFKLIIWCKAIEYAKCFVFYFFLLHIWQDTPIIKIIEQHWMNNEEIGESSLSILARSTSTTPQSSKTRALKENFKLISFINELQEKENIKENKFTEENLFEIHYENTKFLTRVALKLENKKFSEETILFIQYLDDIDYHTHAGQLFLQVYKEFLAKMIKIAKKVRLKKCKIIQV